MIITILIIRMSLEILLGPMFAGKSSAVLRIVNRYKSLKWPICSITHSSDNRFSDEPMLMNHDLASIPCMKWSSLMDHISDSAFLQSKLVIIDEGQFFSDLRAFVEYAVDHCGKNVLIVGLDGDAERKSFGQILECIPLADSVTKLKAFCGECGDGTEAIFTFRKKDVETKEQVLVGGAEIYMPLCRKHYLMMY
jgi:thymidine kinase